MQSSGEYQLLMSYPVAVGSGAEGLLSTIVSVTYAGSGDSTYWPNSFAGSLGSDGALHQEQIVLPAPFLWKQSHAAGVSFRRRGFDH